MSQWPVHARIDGPIVMIGFGSIGKGTLPLIERHFEFDRSRFTVIDPDNSGRRLLDERGIAFQHIAITRDNYRDVLVPLLTRGSGRGFCVNLSVDTSSLAIMELCREIELHNPRGGFTPIAQSPTHDTAKAAARRSIGPRKPAGHRPAGILRRNQQPCSHSSQAERWPSGLRRTLGKRVYFNEYRGFESHSLRHCTEQLAGACGTASSGYSLAFGSCLSLEGCGFSLDGVPSSLGY